MYWTAGTGFIDGFPIFCFVFFQPHICRSWKQIPGSLYYSMTVPLYSYRTYQQNSDGIRPNSQIKLELVYEILIKQYFLFDLLTRRIQRNQEFRGKGFQREQRSFWHTTFRESLVCYTFILTTDAGNGVVLQRSLHSRRFCCERRPHKEAGWTAKGSGDWSWSVISWAIPSEE